MAKLAFCWELGQGMGHLVPYLPLVKRLFSMGHEVSFIVRDAKRVRSVFDGLPVTVEEIQPEFGPVLNPKPSPLVASYATLLLRCGFNDKDHLFHRVLRWLSIIKRMRPDCLIIDHSPTALVAQRICGVPSIITGNGFTLPPPTFPVTPFRFWRKAETAGQPVPTEYETHVTAIINNVLGRTNAKQLIHLCDLYDSDNQWIKSFAELDCYWERSNTTYIGSLVDPDFGVQASWLNAPGPKVFAYLKPSPSVTETLRALKKIEASVLLYAPDLSKEFLDELTPKFCKVSRQPFQLKSILETCDFSINNGTANTIAGLALAGIPQIMTTFTVEQLMAARRVESLGAGIVVRKKQISTIHERIEQLLDKAEFRMNAEQFSSKYRDFDESAQTARMLASLERLGI